MANRYWVGGTATWDATAGTKWALTSGGAGGQAVPTSSDDVFFDANSTGTCTTANGSAVTCLSLNFTGYASTFTCSSGAGSRLDVFGSLLLVGTGTITIRNIQFKSTSLGNTITTAGRVINAVAGLCVSFSGAGGGWALQDNLTTGVGAGSASGVVHNNGAVDLNGQTINTSAYLSNNSNTRSLTFNGGTIIVGDNNAATVWNFSTITGLTFTPDTGTVKDISSINNIFIGGGLTFNNFWYLPPSGTGILTVTGSNTFNDFKIDTTNVATTVKFTNGTTTTVTTFTATGSSGKTITIDSDTTATHSLVKSGGGTISCDWLNIQHSVATPATTWYAGTNSTNNQAVATAGSGWIFTAPPGTTNSNMFLVM